MKLMKGILLAGGAGTRLHPLSLVASKQLLPVYDKPMVYYPLSTLMLMGIRDIMLISTPHDLPRFKELLGNGRRIGINLSYALQPRPEGIAQALLIAEDFYKGDRVSLILGDNIFYGKLDLVRSAIQQDKNSVVFGYWVSDPQRYGVVDFDDTGKALSIEEKPSHPKSNYAVPGLYIYDKDVAEITRTLKPSRRGELEITDVNRAYLAQGRLEVRKLGRGMAWLDTGTHESLLEAANFIATIEHRQGLKVGCLEEVAWRMGFISDAEFGAVIEAYPRNSYRDYLASILERGD